MKKLFICLCLILGGCYLQGTVRNEISRSQIYYGQTLADLYENFGAPQRAERLAYGVSIYTFNQQEIISERVEKRFYDCKLRAFVQNDRVVDWDWQGNNCQFKEKGPDSQIRDNFEGDLSY